MKKTAFILDPKGKVREVRVFATKREAIKTLKPRLLYVADSSGVVSVLQEITDTDGDRIRVDERGLRTWQRAAARTPLQALRARLKGAVQEQSRQQRRALTEARASEKAVRRLRSAIARLQRKASK
jgi:hypothetical protein